MSAIKLRITFTDGTRSWSVPGHAVEFEKIKTGDLSMRLSDAEEYLTRVMGMQVKIETDLR